MRVAQNEDYWIDELRFVNFEAGKEFPMNAFRAYCEMQASFAEKDGFSEIAKCIEAAACKTRRKDRMTNAGENNVRIPYFA